MSEPIKNTLFRFVTLRSPELIAEKDKQDYHIHHPNPTSAGFFKDQLLAPAATASAQAAQLKTRAESFSPLANIAALKEFVGSTLFSFSVWLAKNRYAVFHQQTITLPAPLPATLTNTQVVAVWDNLFYHLITNKNPQLRQHCIEILVASGYLSAAEQPYQHQLAEARVIIPSAFYGGTGSSLLARAAAPATATGEVPVYTGELRKINRGLQAQQKITLYRQLLNELHQAEQQYHKANRIAFTTARRNYENEVAKIFEEYNINNPADAAREAPALQGPTIPTFNFSALPEMEGSQLEGQISATAFNLALQMGLVNNGSFATAYEIINEALETGGEQAGSIAGTGSRTLVVNNMLLPLNERTLPVNAQYEFYMEPMHHQGNRYSIITTINMGYPNAHASAAKYNAETDTGIQIGTAFTEIPMQGNTLSLELFPVDYLTLPATQNEFRFHGTISLAEGLKLLFDVRVNRFEGAWGIMAVEKTGGGEEGGEINITAPAGYGIKRLGVADYRKVEQSVCCYLPGEVSHIENVMAREYKERSSRRLSRLEDTTIFERSMEKEVEKDTSTTERYEMQKEIETVITKETAADAHASVQGDYGKVKFDAGASFAFNTSKEDSNRTAVNYSKEVTEKALERVVQKIREERTIRIVEEFEEQHKHGFDNRQGEKHVSGVYRWVDKVYKNQVYNYGKRLMYEFMIPQPATFHNEAIKILAEAAGSPVLEKPVDPRTANSFFRVANPTQLNSFTFPYWAGIYQADLKSAADEFIAVSQAFSLSGTEATNDDNRVTAKSFKMDIPEGYEALNAVAGASYVYFGSNRTPLANIRVGNSANLYIGGNTGTRETTVVFTPNPVRKELGIAAESRNLGGIIINVTANCRRTAESYQNWQIEAFNAIIESYNQRLEEYNKALESIKQPEKEKAMNPGFYRLIENTVLRKNCVTYLVNHGNLGKQFYQPGNTENIQPLVTKEMDAYAALVKFIEQAFEWDIMSYKFYPFYWGAKKDWHTAYQQEVDDALFRSFLQSGMARVVVSVRPGFEEAVMYFMATGNIWNGGQVPAIGDDLYLSIVEELKNPVYYIEETWETRVPTTLTVIQAGSIGLNAEGLPCDCGNNNGILQTNDQMGVVLPK